MRHPITILYPTADTRIVTHAYASHMHAMPSYPSSTSYIQLPPHACRVLTTCTDTDTDVTPDYQCVSALSINNIRYSPTRMHLCVPSVCAPTCNQPMSTFHAPTPRSPSPHARRLPETMMQTDDTFPPFAPPPPCRSRTLLPPDPFLLDNIPLPPPKGDRNTLSNYKDHGRPSLDGSSSSTTCSQSSAVSIHSSRSVGWRPNSHRHDAKKRRRRLHAGDLYLVHTSTGAYPTKASPDSPSNFPGLLVVSSGTQPWRYPRTKSVDARTAHGHAFSSVLGPATSTQKATAGAIGGAAAPGDAREPRWEQVGGQWIKRHQAKQQARQMMLQLQQTKQPAISAISVAISAISVADAAHAVVGGGGAAAGEHAGDGPPLVHLPAPAGPAPQHPRLTMQHPPTASSLSRFIRYSDEGNHPSSRGRTRPSAASTSRARVGVLSSAGPAGGEGCAGGGAGAPCPAVCGLLHDNRTRGQQRSPTTSPTGEWDPYIRERSSSAPARMTLPKAPESYASAKKWVQDIEASASESWWFQEMATPPDSAELESPTTRNQEAQFAETDHGDSGVILLSRSLSLPPARPSLGPSTIGDIGIDIGIDGACAEGVGHELTAPPLASRLARAASFGAQRVATSAGESVRDAALASRSSACRTSLLSLSRSLGAVATPGSARRHSHNSKHPALPSKMAASSAIAADSNTHRDAPCRVVDF